MQTYKELIKHFVLYRNTAFLAIMIFMYCLLSILSILAFNCRPIYATSTCAMATMDKHVSHPGCTAVTIPVTVCQGSCKSISSPLMDKPWFTTSCKCCRRTDDEVRTVELMCSDGATVEKNIVFVRDCECKPCHFA